MWKRSLKNRDDSISSDHRYSNEDDTIIGELILRGVGVLDFIASDSDMLFKKGAGGNNSFWWSGQIAPQRNATRLC
jgi:hypothetical protein